MSGRSALRRRASKVRRRMFPKTQVHHPHLRTEANPERPELLPDFRFFAVLGTYMEEDIVESTVRNAFAQGVEKVFLLDDGSTDQTVPRAVAAGATLSMEFSAATTQEVVRNLLMSSVVVQESQRSLAEHVWWLWLDADEFPEGPGGMTIADYLATLDQRFRLVGSTYCNHFPTQKPANIRGVHPVDLQPMWAPFPFSHCAQGHFKHPLQRFDRHGVFLQSDPGFHGARTRDGLPVYEPEGGITTHHIQYREEEATRARMASWCTPERTVVNARLGYMANPSRQASLNAVYAQRWDEVDNRGNWGNRAPLGVTLRRWEGPAVRWYDSVPADGLSEAER